MDTISPTKQEFLDAARHGRILPLHAVLDQPALTPVAALEALRSGGHAVLLESARVTERTGRYSFVTADPYLIFRSQGENVEPSLPAALRASMERRATVNKNCS
jgi:anthranilate synthase component 1